MVEYEQVVNEIKSVIDNRLSSLNGQKGLNRHRLLVPASAVLDWYEQSNIPSKLRGQKLQGRVVIDLSRRLPQASNRLMRLLKIPPQEGIRDVALHIAPVGHNYRPAERLQLFDTGYPSLVVPNIEGDPSTVIPTYGDLIALKHLVEIGIDSSNEPVSGFLVG